MDEVSYNIIQDREPAGKPGKNRLSGIWNSFVSLLKRIGAWFGRIRKPLRKFWDWFRPQVRKIFSPAFLVMLGISFLLWYTLKLGDTYNARVPFDLDIDGRQVRVTAIVNTTGYKILSYRYSRKDIVLGWGDIEVSPSSVNPQAVIIAPESLQRLISIRNPEIQIVSMSDIPEVEL